MSEVGQPQQVTAAIDATDAALVAVAAADAVPESGSPKHGLERPQALVGVRIPGGRAPALRRFIFELYDRFSHLTAHDIHTVARYGVLSLRFQRSEARLRKLGDTTIGGEPRKLLGEQRTLAAELRQLESALALSFTTRADLSLAAVGTLDGGKLSIAFIDQIIADAWPAVDGGAKVLPEATCDIATGEVQPSPMPPDAPEMPCPALPQGTETPPEQEGGVLPIPKAEEAADGQETDEQWRARLGLHPVPPTPAPLPSWVPSDEAIEAAGGLRHPDGTPVRQRPQTKFGEPHEYTPDPRPAPSGTIMGPPKRF